MTQLSQKTQEVMKWFEQITRIPRCSKNEEKIRAWLLDWAKQHSFGAKTDDAGNVVISVPASPGFEKSPTVVIQGHLDMVCEKTPDSPHDFSKDPIKLVYEGEWLTADRTTLGADNGIAIALAMTLSLDKHAAHPPLELLFTVDEETGLTGANQLKSGLLKGRFLLNVDSEDEGVFTVGCAGGITTEITVPVKHEDAPKGETYVVKGGGMKGGHSGVEINQQRANAIKVLFRAIQILGEKFPLRIATADGGSAHNAIPRDASVTFVLPADKFDGLKQELAAIEKMLKVEYVYTDPNLTLTVDKAPAAAEVLTAASQKQVIDVIMAMPTGVAAMATAVPGLVETSNNLAKIRFNEGKLVILTSQRSSVVSRLQAITRRIHAVAHLAGGTARNSDGYPPWEANWNSPLLAKAKEVYKKRFGKDPVVEVIHAGLECGIIGDKYPGMDMLSFGPTIRNPHSPDERIKVSDIDKIWDFMCDLMVALK